jgi:hypothetical protein
VLARRQDRLLLTMGVVRAGRVALSGSRIDGGPANRWRCRQRDAIGDEQEAELDAGASTPVPLVQRMFVIVAGCVEATDDRDSTADDRSLASRFACLLRALCGLVLLPP